MSERISKRSVCHAKRAFPVDDSMIIPLEARRKIPLESFVNLYWHNGETNKRELYSVQLKSRGITKINFYHKKTFLKTKFSQKL